MITEIVVPNLNLWFRQQCLEDAKVKDICSHGQQDSVYHLPTDEKSKRLWLNNLNLEKPPETANDCSCHFVNKSQLRKPHIQIWGWTVSYRHYKMHFCSCPVTHEHRAVCISPKTKTQDRCCWTSTTAESRVELPLSSRTPPTPSIGLVKLLPSSHWYRSVNAGHPN